MRLLSYRRPYEEDEKQATNGKKVLANHIPNKRLRSKHYKEFSELEKWAKDMNRYLNEKARQVANKHMNKVFNIIGRQGKTHEN